MSRTGVAVIIRCVTENNDGQETTFYGPFLPHAGAATQTMVDKLQAEHAERQERGAVHRNAYRYCFVEDVFIGEGESDAKVVSA